MRWVTFGIALVAVFLVSVGLGAFIARQRGPTLVANVATPTPGVTAAMTASPTPIPPTQPPATQPPVVPAEQFARDLLAAFQTGDTTFMFLHLHPVVFDRYGEGQCRAHVDGFTADPSAMWTVISSMGPSSWDWVTDN